VHILFAIVSAAAAAASGSLVHGGLISHWLKLQRRESTNRVRS